MEVAREYKRKGNVTISCVNFKTNWGNKPANKQRMKAFVAEAASRHSDIVIFPELALSGFDCDESWTEDGCAMHGKLAETIPGPSTEEMIQVARAHQLYIVFGMPEQDMHNSRIKYISAAVVGPEGFLGAYRKVQLSGPTFTETKCFKAGSTLPVFNTRYGPLGVQICVDLWTFPELTRILVLKGARIIAVPVASPAGPGKPHFVVEQTKARATENRVYIATANLVGREVKIPFCGHSVIAGPDSEKTNHIYIEADEQEGIISAHLDLANLERQRWEHRWRGDVILTELALLKRQLNT